jgi:hypothetical protein
MTEPLLPDTTSDEREVGWGDDLDEVDEADRDDDEADRDDDKRLTSEVPPHY